MQPAHRPAKIDPDGALASLLLATVTAAGLVYVDIIPALVIGLQDGLGFTPQASGGVVAANSYGASIGGLIAVLIVRAMPWRPVVFACLLALILIDLVSTMVVTPGALSAIRFCHGLIGGISVGFGYAAIGRSRSPERGFAMLFTIHFGIGGIGVFVLPSLVPEYGAAVLFYGLMAFNLLAILALPFVPRTLGAPRERAFNASRARPTMLIGGGIALLALFVFQTASIASTAYLFNIGRDFGHSTDFISASFASLYFLAACSALVAAHVMLRFGRLWPIILAVFATAAGRALFLWGDHATIFLIAGCLVGATHAYVVPYLIGLCSAFDPDGRVTTFAGFCSKMGLATGPLVGGLLYTAGIAPLILASVVGVSIAGAFAALACVLLDRTQRPAAPDKSLHATDPLTGK